MAIHHLAYAAYDPAPELAVPEALGDEERDQLAELVEGAFADARTARAVGTLEQVGERVAAGLGEGPDLVLARLSLRVLVARVHLNAGEHQRADDLLVDLVEEIGGLVDEGGPGMLALWLAARFSRYWADLNARGAGVTTFGDLAVVLGVALDATRDGRFDEATGFGLLTSWSDQYERSGVREAALLVRSELVKLAADLRGPLDPVTLALRHLEADLLETYGRLDQAWKRFERLVRDLERSGENRGRLALQVRSSHAFLAGRRGSGRRAVRLYRALVTDIEAGRFTGDSTGPFDVDEPLDGTTYQSGRALVLMNLATWLDDQGQLEEAAAELRKVIDIASSVTLEPTEPLHDAAEALQHAQRALGTTLRELGRHDESIALFRSLLAGRLAQPLPDVPDPDGLLAAQRDVEIDEARDLLMRALVRVDDHEGARSIGVELHKGRSRYLGPTHPLTLLAAVQLAASEHALGVDGAEGRAVQYATELERRVGPRDQFSLYAHVLLQDAAARAGEEGAGELARLNLKECLDELGPRHHVTLDARRAVDRA